MGRSLSCALFALLGCHLLHSTFAATIANQKRDSIIRRHEELDASGRFRVEWEVNLDTEFIVFNVTAATTGFVGFGISNVGGMKAADIVVGGIWPNGTQYFKDYYGEVDKGAPVLDSSQDWTLITVSENTTHTRLSFSRILNTCDDQDVPITNGTTNFIWSLGATDVLEYHNTNRGTSVVNILDAPTPDLDLSQFERWNIHRNMTMPPRDTSYWCSTHKMPKFNGSHDIVAFTPYLPTETSVKHTHHFSLYKCIAPAGQDPVELFDPHLGLGADCYVTPELVPHRQYCLNFVYIWATGGKGLILPETIGLPFHSDQKDEYYLLEIHYDNPQNLSNAVVNSGLNVFHTSHLRPIRAGVISVSHDTKPSHMIPPKTTNYTTVGHCSAACTNHFPPEGLTVFNVFLHSHMSGRRVKLRHFRDGKELPWVANDDNYDFDYQSNRPVPGEGIKILPGDRFSYECTADTTWTEGAVLAGASSRDEMCQSFMWVYPLGHFLWCASEYNDYDKLFGKFGIEEVDWTKDAGNPTVISPPALANKTFTTVLNEFPWTEAFKREVEAELRFSPHKSLCSNDAGEMITYPVIDEPYKPPEQCLAQQPYRY